LKVNKVLNNNRKEKETIMSKKVNLNTEIKKMKNTKIFKEQMNDLNKREYLQNHLNNKMKYQDELSDVKSKLMKVFKKDFNSLEVSDIRKDVMSEIRKVTDKITDDYLNDRYFVQTLTFNEDECYDENNEYDDELEEKLYEEFEETVKEQFNHYIHDYLQTTIYEVFQNVLVDTKKMSLEEYYKLRDKEQDLIFKIKHHDYFINESKERELKS